jgi:hypothetical protein
VFCIYWMVPTNVMPAKAGIHGTLVTVLHELAWDGRLRGHDFGNLLLGVQH